MPHGGADADTSIAALHHTLGTGASQAAAGNHIHTGVAGVPTAAVSMYAGVSIPVGWLLCDGTAVSRTTYSDLFTALGTTYGVGDGSTTFNLPNFASAFARGNSRAASGGANTHQHSALSAGAPAGSNGTEDSSHTHTTPLGSLTGNGSASLNSVNDGHNHGGSTGTQSLSPQTNTTATGASTRLTSPDPHSHTIGVNSNSHSHTDAGHNHSTQLITTQTENSTHSHVFTGSALGTHQHDTQNNIPAYVGVQFIIKT